MLLLVKKSAAAFILPWKPSYLREVGRLDGMKELGKRKSDMSVSEFLEKLAVRRKGCSVDTEFFAREDAIWHHK